MKDETIEQTEDQAVAADRERERQHGDRRETRTADKLPAGVPNVLNERFHESSPLLSGKRRLTAVRSGARQRPVSWTTVGAPRWQSDRAAR